jgi:Transglutaminase-like superfamily
LSGIANIARAARLGAGLIQYRLGLERRIRRDSLTDILREVEEQARAMPVRALDREALFALRAAESLLRRARVVPNTCLFRALGRYAVLRRSGYRAVFVMGMRAVRDGGIGHAWIEIDGAPFQETIAPELVDTLRYPA